MFRFGEIPLSISDFPKLLNSVLDRPQAVICNEALCFRSTLKVSTIYEFCRKYKQWDVAMIPLKKEKRRENFAARYFPHASSSENAQPKNTIPMRHNP
jgi:hypothetical protein